MHNALPFPSKDIQPPPASAANSSTSQEVIGENKFTVPDDSLPQVCDGRGPAGPWYAEGSIASFSGNQLNLTKNNSLRSTLSRHFKSDLDTTHAGFILILCSFVSGLIDGLSFNAWGSFASMQTGNTVFIALGASGQPAYPAYLWAKSLIALTVFILSNILFIHVSRALRPRRRSTMILSFAVQTAALLTAAILVQLGVVSPKPEDPRAPIEWIQVLPISLLSFQAGGQICASRILGIDEVPTVVLTTLLCDLLVDPKLTDKVNPQRNRRAGSFLALFLGAMTAGGLSKSVNLAASLWFAMGLKGGITVVWCVWKGARAG